jgi:molecular chaperone GrpE
MDQEIKQEKNELDECKKQAEEYLNGWKRAQADFINYKKDEARRIQDLIKFGNEGLILKFLDIIDDLERALNHAPEGIPPDWLSGTEQVNKNAQALLKKYGVEKIKTVGEQFNPEFHEAVSGEGDNIGEEIRAGYTMNGKVIRPARVVLTN